MAKLHKAPKFAPAFESPLMVGGNPQQDQQRRWVADGSPKRRIVRPRSLMITTDHFAKHCRMAGPVGAGLGRFSGYRPYNGLPLRLRRTWRSSRASTIRDQTRMHSKPAIRSGFFRNIGATASGPFK